MTTFNTAPNSELPTTRALIKSTIIAAVSACVILVTVVLPAEYGIDFTGVGSALGLTTMGEIKTSLADEAVAEEVVAEEAASAANTQEAGIASPTATAMQVTQDTGGKQAVGLQGDTMTLALQPDEGKEIKLAMKKGDKVEFLWWSDGGKVNFDTHADSKELKIKYHGYGKGSELRSEGTLEAAFDGQHGWFWRNRTGKTLRVTLHTKGIYSAIKELK